MAAKLIFIIARTATTRAARTVRSGAKPMARTMARPAGLRRRSLMGTQATPTIIWLLGAGNRMRVGWHAVHLAKRIGARWWDSI